MPEGLSSGESGEPKSHENPFQIMERVLAKAKDIEEIKKITKRGINVDVENLVLKILLDKFPELASLKGVQDSTLAQIALRVCMDSVTNKEEDFVRVNEKIVISPSEIVYAINQADGWGINDLNLDEISRDTNGRILSMSFSPRRVEDSVERFMAEVSYLFSFPQKYKNSKESTPKYPTLYRVMFDAEGNETTPGDDDGIIAYYNESGQWIFEDEWKNKKY